MPRQPNRGGDHRPRAPKGWGRGRHGGGVGAKGAGSGGNLRPGAFGAPGRRCCCSGDGANGVGEHGAGGAAAGEHRGVRGLEGHRPCYCGQRCRPDCRVHVGLRGGTQRGDVRGAPSRGDHPVRVPLEFLRNEQEEEAVWKAQFEAGSHILGHLDRALELHRTTDFQIMERFLRRTYGQQQELTGRIYLTITIIS